MTLKNQLPQVGQKLGKYTTIQIEPLPEINATLVLLEHDNGAKHAHIAREDDNLGFNVTFPTVPKDSTGVAHILEHVVLMGSEKYPVKDPFFAMSPRSLNTFMNAMTASDWTTYPFSTRNINDYFNLLSVYLDSVFFPLLRYESFRQDGHRFEFEDPEDPTTPLKLQGVVYNEMKGAMASPGSVLWRAFGKTMFPDLTYANNSGGSPEHIPELTYEQLKAFHAAHYHPSNAYFYTYGNHDLAKVLDHIEEQVMSRFSAQQLDTSIPDQTPFTEPKTVQEHYPSSDTERGGQAVVGWKLGLSSDPNLNLRWSVLSDILLGNPAAPLTHALISSGLGSALAMSGYQDSYREGTFATGLKGLPTGKTQDVEKLVLDTLEKIATDGIPSHLIENSLHQFEIQQKEVSNSGFPYALGVGFQMLGSWMNGGNPAKALRLDEEIKALHADLDAGKPVFEDMIRQDLLQNPHRITLELIADPDLASKTEEDERALVQKLSANFTDEDHQRIVQESKKLKELQATPYDPSSLPTLTLEDIQTKVARPEYTNQELGRAKIGRVPQPTNGLTYLDLKIRLPELPADLLNVLSLYAATVTRSGAADLDYTSQAERIEAETGGISASVGIGNAPNDIEKLRFSVSFRGKALERNASKLVNILRDVIATPKFDRERLRQLLEQRLSGYKAGLVSGGHAYAMRLAAAQVSPNSALDEQLNGLEALKTLREIVSAEDQDAQIDALISKFEAIRDLLLQGAPQLCLTAQPEQIDVDLSPITNLFSGDTPTSVPQPTLPQRKPQARLTDSPVAFNAIAYPTIPYTHADSPALLVLSRLLSSRYMLPELREKGGAYGGFASFGHRAGVFRMGSYRDPHVARTYNVYHEARQFLDSEIDPQQLTEAILDASSILDPLTSPDSVGSMRFFSDLAGFNPEVQEDYKARLLKVTLDDLRRVANTYLKQENAAYAMIAGKDPNEDVKDLGLEFEVQQIEV